MYEVDVQDKFVNSQEYAANFKIRHWDLNIFFQPRLPKALEPLTLGLKSEVSLHKYSSDSSDFSSLPVRR